MYLVAVVKRLKALDQQRRRDLLADPWNFKAWLVADDGGEQMMRHILLHLLFPDEFERIASGTHKYRIRDQLIGLVEDPEHIADGAEAESRRTSTGSFSRSERGLPSCCPRVTSTGRSTFITRH